MAQNTSDLGLLNELEHSLAELFKLYTLHIDILKIFQDKFFSICKKKNDIHLSINIAYKLSNYAWGKRVSLNNMLTKIKYDIEDNNDMRDNLQISLDQVQLDFDKAVVHEEKVNQIVDNLETEYNTASKNVDLLICCMDYLGERVKIILNKKDSLNSHIAWIRMKYIH